MSSPSDSDDCSSEDMPANLTVDFDLGYGVARRTALVLLLRVLDVELASVDSDDVLR